MPTTRGTNNHVLTRDDTAGTGGTAWKETTLTPTITSLTYPTGDDGNATTALDSGSGAGTQTLIITGTNFTATVTSVQITVGGQTYGLGSSYSRDSATQITVSNVVKRAVGTYNITVTNDTGMSATTTVDFSGTPSFTTSADLGSIFAGTTLSKTIVTSGGDGTITLKSDPSGTAKPDWMTIGGTGSGGSSWTEVTGSAGLSTALAGTSENTGDATTYNIGIIVRDSQNQGSDREFSLVVADYAIGGNSVVTSITGFRYHVFTSSGTFTTYGIFDYDYLIIGGGGGGNGDSEGYGGGGGGGGFVQGTSQSMGAGDHTITVGDGGAVANNGDPSSIAIDGGSTLTANGGGRGGSGQVSGNTSVGNGADGGSGGGGAGLQTSHSNYPFTGGTGSQGNDGGTGHQYGAGGGGGAASDGANATGNGTGGAGGHGENNIWSLNDADSDSIFTTLSVGHDVGGLRYFAGGGGGSGGDLTGQSNSAGGNGGGGEGAARNGSSTAGTANTGGGGGGGRSSSEGASAEALESLSSATQSNIHHETQQKHKE